MKVSLLGCLATQTNRGRQSHDPPPLVVSEPAEPGKYYHDLGAHVTVTVSHGRLDGIHGFQKHATAARCGSEYFLEVTNHQVPGSLAR